MILGEYENQECVLFWLLEFSQQAEQIMKHEAESVWEDSEQCGIFIATHVSE